MGFRTGSYATVWSIEPKSSKCTKGSISVSRKNNETGKFETEFMDFVSFLGATAASQAAGLKKQDRIKLGEVDVGSTYNKEKNTKYYDFKIFSFEKVEQPWNRSTGNTGGTGNSAQSTVDDGDFDQDLPF